MGANHKGLNSKTVTRTYTLPRDDTKIKRKEKNDVYSLGGKKTNNRETQRSKHLI